MRASYLTSLPRTALRAGLALLLAFAAGMPSVALAASSAAWDSTADFQTNGSTTGQPTTLTGVTTAAQSGALTLPGTITRAAAGDDHTVGLKPDGTAVAVGDNAFGQCEVSAWTGITAVSAGTRHTVGLKSDGSVVVAGLASSVAGWTGITAVSAGYAHTVGLKSDGTVVASGDNLYGQSNVATWTGVAAVSTGVYHTVGLKSDGTVVASGDNSYGQADVSSWTDITAVAAGYYHTIGLKSDGTVVAVGASGWGQCDVSSWTDIASVAAGYRHTIGVKADGTAVATGDNASGQCDVSSWTKVVAADAGMSHSVAVKRNGGVAAAGDNTKGQSAVSGWIDYVYASPGYDHTVGLRSDRTVAAIGGNAHAQCDVSSMADVYSLTAATYRTHIMTPGRAYSVGSALYGGGQEQFGDIVASAAGSMYTLYLKPDGTVALLCNFMGPPLEDLATWRNVTAIATGEAHAVGLKADGTVMACGNAANRRTEVGGFSDIVAIAAGTSFTLGLKSDGTVMTTPESYVSDVSTWTGIVAISAGSYHAVGLKADGTVVAVGNNPWGQCDVSSWTDVVSVAAGYSGTTAITATGTVLATGRNDSGQLDVAGWTSLGRGAFAGSLGGGGSAVGLRRDAGAPTKWVSLLARTSTLRLGDAVKFAVRTSNDGATWSAPLGRDGLPIDWTTGSGNYLGLSAVDLKPYTSLAGIPQSRFIDVVVRLETSGVSSPALERLELVSNFAPAAGNDTVETTEDAVVAVTAENGLLANDTDGDGDALVVSDVTQSGHGAVVWQPDGSFEYLPEDGFEGTDSFTYRVSDGTTSSGGMVTISVAPKPEPGLTGGSSRTIAYASGYTFAGRLTMDGMPLPGKRVLLMSSTNGSAFTPTSMAATTTANGDFSFNVKPSSLTWYRAWFQETQEYGESFSTAAKVSVQASVGTPAAPATMSPTRSYTVYGYLKPRHTAGTSPVRIYRWRLIGGTWKSYGYVNAKASNYSSYSKYAASVRLSSAGRWRLRAYHADTGHAAAWSSGFDYVTVK